MLSSANWRNWSVATGNGRRIASEMRATRVMIGTGIGMMMRRFPRARATSRVISAYVQ